MNEIAAGLEQWSERVADARRRVREAGPAEKATRIRYAGQCRREAFKYLAMACGSLRMWPGREQVGEPGVRAAHEILLTLDGPEIRKVLPLITAAAQQRRIAALYLAEATDVLCAAERRPQVYGTLAGHPIADEARVDSVRAALALPPLAPQPLIRPAAMRSQRHEAPLGPELAVLDGLLTDLPAAPRLPRTVRRTVAAHSTWGCAYCGGPAQPEAEELEIRSRVWRICAPCALCPDTPEDRLLDVLMAKGGVPEATAKVTAYLARSQGWRLPLRYEQPTTRPNHRAQPRWSHVPDTAVDKLTVIAEQRRPDVTSAAVPTQRPGQVPAPHPELLRSPKALALLALWPGQALTSTQIGQALQLAPATVESHGLLITNVGDLQTVFASPPDWLVDYHRVLAAQRAANRTRQLNKTNRKSATQARIRSTSPSSPTPAGPPDPRMLVSGKAERILARPHSDALQPNQVAKALQVAHQTIVKNRLNVRNVGDLTAVFSNPPEWLVAFHRKLACERAANLIRQAGLASADAF